MAGELGYVRVRSGEFLAGEVGFVSAWQVSLRCVFILVRQVWCGASMLGGAGYVQVGLGEAGAVGCVGVW